MLHYMKSDNQPGSEARPASERNSPLTSVTRRSFLQTLGLSTAALAVAPTARSQEKPIQGFEQAPTAADASKGWKPVSER